MNRLLEPPSTAVRLARAWNRRTAAVAALAPLTLALAAPSAVVASTVKQSAVVSTASSGIGRILVDRQGRTLYLFDKDARGTSACTGPCASYWPPLLTTGKPLAGNGVRSALLGTTRRADGSLQVTYDRHPLYRFALDTKAGETKGQNTRAFGAEWYAVSPSGAEIDRPASQPAATGNGTAAGGYGY
jgi:predicted lipoprotein with Yx(FWY)xxD motif